VKASSSVGGLAALALLLVVSVALKLYSIAIISEPDRPKLMRALVSAMVAGGYQATSGVGNWWSSGLVSAHKGACKVSLRDATLFGPDVEAVTSRRMNGGRPIRYIRNGQFLPAYPSIRIETEWRLQRELSRLGWRYSIAPVIAVGASNKCWPDARLLRDVKFFYK
jgi:hypothetical protein